MRSWSLPIGRYFGIKVFVHWTFWILVIWIFLLHFGAERDVRQGLLGALFVLALFACVVLHEFGHALTAKRFGIVTRDITLYPIGGISSFESLPQKPSQELLVGIAGPLVNVVIALVLWIYLAATGQLPDLSAVSDTHDMFQVPFLWNLFLANAVLAIFNLIPAFPMDGGRVFRSLLSFFTDRVTATRIAAGIGQFLAIIFVFLGFFYNFWLVFIGLFIYIGAGGEASFERTKAALSGLRVRDAVMNRFSLLAPDNNLGKAAELLLNGQETEFVVSESGKPIGILTKDEIIKGLSEKGREASVSEYMRSEFLVVKPNVRLVDFLQTVLEKGQSVALVMDGDRLLGLIDRENVEEKVLIQEALKKREENL